MAAQVNDLAKAKEGHRLQVAEASVAKRRILDEMRAVRITQEERLCETFRTLTTMRNSELLENRLATKP